MPGDHSRLAFDPADDHAGVLMQQGGLMVDADHNALVEVIDRRTRADTIDAVGRAAVPRETPEGFQITFTDDSLLIGPGRAYVDGLLAENRGGGERGFDATLAELRGSEALPYAEQPHLPDPPELPDGDMLVYLDVCRRDVTAVEDPGLLDPAIGFATSTRTQTVWQVHALALEDGDEGVDCSTPLAEIPSWLRANPPAAGRLTSSAVGTPESDDPCELAPQGGFRGIENRLYCVMIHTPGEPGEATFKWSRDNASLVVSVLAVDALRTLTVDGVGRDATVRFAAGDWVEVLDDRLELSGVPGALRQVAGVDPVTGTIELAQELPADVFNVGDPAVLHTRARRWDQAGEVLDADGTPIGDVDDGGGAIGVPQAGGVTLEDGIVVSLAVAAPGGRFRTGDHWSFAARTADGSVEELDAAPPRGVHHHHCTLAIRRGAATSDCRSLWPAELEDDCSCTTCVSAESHESGEMTIQRAIEEAERTGGTVCLGPGDYHITEPLAIARSRSLRISGQAASATRIVASGHAAVHVETCADVELRDLGIVMLGSVGIGLRNVAGFTLSGCSIESRARLRRGPLGLGGSADRTPLGGIAVGMTGVVAGVAIRDCVLGAGVAGTAIGKLGSVGEDLASDERAALAAMDRYAEIGLPHRLLGIAALRPRSSRLASLNELRTARAEYDPPTAFGPTAANIQRLGPLLAVDIAVERCHLSGRFAVGLAGWNLLGGRVAIRANVIDSVAAGIVVVGSAVPDGLARAFRLRTGSTMTVDGAQGAGPAQVSIEGNLVSSAFGEAVVVGADAAQVSSNQLTGAGGQRPLAGAGVVAIGPGLDRRAGSLRITGNRIVDVARAAVSIDCRLSDLDVSANLVENAGRSAILMEDDATADAALVHDNQLRRIAPQLNEPGSSAFGIRLIGSGRAVIAGNTISGVAAAATDLVTRRGIQVVAPDGVRVVDNVVIGVGPLTDFAGTSIAIEVLSGAGRVDVSGNDISRSGSVGGAEGSNWRALRVGDPLHAALGIAILAAVGVAPVAPRPVPPARFVALSNPLTLLEADGVRHLITGSFVLILPRTPEEITIRGNHLHAVGRQSAVLIVSDGSCVFSDNEVHRSGAGAQPAAHLVVGAGVVQGNRATSAADDVAAIALDVPPDAMTALGNICAGGIELNGSPLPDPWGALNASP